MKCKYETIIGCALISASILLSGKLITDKTESEHKQSQVIDANYVTIQLQQQYKEREATRVHPEKNKSVQVENRANQGRLYVDNVRVSIDKTKIRADVQYSVPNEKSLFRTQLLLTRDEFGIYSGHLTASDNYKMYFKTTLTNQGYSDIEKRYD